MRIVIKRIKIFLLVTFLAMGLLTPAFPAPKVEALSGSDFQAGHIIDDSIFFDSTTMTAQDIEAFLVSMVPSCQSSSPTCLRDYMVSVPSKSPDAYCSGGISPGTKIAAQVIADAAKACSINPKSLIVLLQKETGLVTSTSPTSDMYQIATGYGCPDSASVCDSDYYGFFNQVYLAARQFQRYAKQPNLFSYKAGQNNSIQYNPNGACGSSTVFIQNQATAGLYNYTPYQPNVAALNNLYGTGDSCSSYGNRNFWRLFTDWFGTTLDGKCNYDPPASAITSVSFRKFRRNLDSGTFVIYTGTGTGCVEDHSWLPGSGFSAWQSHIASNLPVTSPTNGVVKFADLSGSGVDNPVYIGLSGTGSGTAEFHVWTPDMRRWIVHTSSNLPLTATGTNPSVQNSSIEFADLDGNGTEEPVAIQYKNTASGFVEFWIWSPGLQGWQVHAVSNLPAPLDPTQMQVGFDDLYGNGRDQPVAFGINNTGTGKVEFHVWAPGVQSWQQHIVSNLSTGQLGGCSISFADLSTSGFDNGVVACTQGTGSGRIEFHVWNPGLNTWQGHYVSNQSIL